METASFRGAVAGISEVFGRVGADQAKTISELLGSVGADQTKTISEVFGRVGADQAKTISELLGSVGAHHTKAVSEQLGKASAKTISATLGKVGAGYTQTLSQMLGKAGADLGLAGLLDKESLLGRESLSKTLSALSVQTVPDLAAFYGSWRSGMGDEAWGRLRASGAVIAEEAGLDGLVDDPTADPTGLGLDEVLGLVFALAVLFSLAEAGAGVVLVVALQAAIGTGRLTFDLAGALSERLPEEPALLAWVSLLVPLLMSIRRRRGGLSQPPDE